MFDYKNLWKVNLILGWLAFWLSMLLPMNTSLGGLTRAGKPYYGFLNLFYWIISLFTLPMHIFDYRDLFFTLNSILMAGVGICCLLMIFGVPFLLFINRVNKAARYVLISSAVYVCVVGTIVNWHFYPIRYGHIIWCLSFVLMALGLILKEDYENTFS